MRKLLFIILLPHLLYSQNLITNPSFESQITPAQINPLREYTYLMDWNAVFTRNSFGTGISGCYIDTSLFNEIDQEQPITHIFREIIVKPLKGKCYIRQFGSLTRSYFEQALKTQLIDNEAYIVFFAYQIKSFTNEYQKAGIAHFGISFSSTPLKPIDFSNPNYAHKPASRFRELHYITQPMPSSNQMWVYASFTLMGNKNFKYLNVGSHTDFPRNKKDSILAEENFNARAIEDISKGYNKDSVLHQNYLNLRADYPFLWYVDEVKMFKLSDYLKGNFTTIKNMAFEIPVDTSLALKDNLYIGLLIKQLKTHQKEFNKVSIWNDPTSKIEIDQLIEYLKSQGLSKQITSDSSLEIHHLPSVNSIYLQKITVLIQ